MKKTLIVSSCLIGLLALGGCATGSQEENYAERTPGAKVEDSKTSRDLGWDAIHFFGDKTYKGGNDNEIFEDPRTTGHTVLNPPDTMRQLKELFPDLA